jgi:hypothetical protein
MPVPLLSRTDPSPPSRALEQAKNIAFTYGVTGLDLLYLATTVLVFPRIAEKAVFAEYRILILYSGYAGFLHLGLLSGFYLESLHSQSLPHKLALLRKTRRLLLGLLLLLAPIGAVGFWLLNPTESATTVAALLLSWFLLNGQTLCNYAAQTQGGFNRFFAYNCIGRCAGLAFICIIAATKTVSTLTLDCSFLLPIAVSVAAAEALSYSRFRAPAADAQAEAAPVSVTLQWRSCAHLYAANVFATLALSVDKVVIASQFARKTFADYSFAFSLSSLVLYAGDGIATATLPLLLRLKAADRARLQSHSIWIWLYWCAPFAFWPATFFVDTWYSGYDTCKPFLLCFCATLPAIIYCKSYCGSAAIAAKASHLQSRVNLLGLAAIAAGIGAAEYHGGGPLYVCLGWGAGVFGWAVLCCWLLGKSNDERVRAELKAGLLQVALSSAAFGLGYGATRRGFVAGAVSHAALAAAALTLPRLWNLRHSREDRPNASESL